MCSIISCADFQDKVFDLINSEPSAINDNPQRIIRDSNINHPVCIAPVIQCASYNEMNQRIQKAAKNTPMFASVSGKGEITVEWGGKEGTKISGGVSGGVSDSKGNKAEVKVEVENDGSGKATLSAEHEKKSSS